MVKIKLIAIIITFWSLIVLITLAPQLIIGQNAFCHFDNYKFKPLVQHTQSQEQSVKINDNVLLIRTVIHQVYHQDSEKLDLSFLKDIIDNVNLYFSGAGADTSLILPEHHELIGNTKIQFCLANNDPYGNPTSGVTYTKSDTSIFQPVEVDGCIIENWRNGNAGGKAPWPVERYLNIWLMKNVYELNLGQPYPSMEPIISYVDCYNVPPGPSLDFNMILDENSLNYGKQVKVLTHELGHTFGLLHTYGPYSIFSELDLCEYDDYVDDTPICKQGEIFCDFARISNSCTEETNDKNDNVSNIMNGGCMLMFTQGQSDIMRENILNNSPSLVKNQSECGVLSNIGENDLTLAKSITLNPNPNNGNFDMDFNQNSNSKSTITILNIYGEIVFQNNYYDSKVRINSDLPKGVYILMIESESEKLRTLKFCTY